MIKRLMALLLLVAVFFGQAALAESAPAAGEAGTDAAADGAFPALNEQGFLDEGEFVFQDKKNGVWRYASQTLKVEIHRRSSAKPKMVWYEAEIWSAAGETFRMLANDEEHRMKSQDWPYKIARKHQSVFAMSSDYAQLRIAQHKRVGILVRNGEIVSERTLPKNKGVFPNLDTLALLPDGDMQVFWSDEKKAKDYVAMGATDVLAFGPWLIRDGELNTKGLKKYGTGRAPRAAIGMVEPGHYIALMAEGRHNQSNGASITFMAEKLKELGCTVGFNLDGGQTSTMVFMGKQIVHIGKTKGKNASARKTAEILAIGTSDQVAGQDEKIN